MSQTFELREEVKLVERDCGGIFLIDLNADTYAIPDSEELSELVSTRRFTRRTHSLADQLSEAGLLESAKPAHSRNRTLQWLLWLMKPLMHGPGRAGRLVVCSYILLKHFGWYDIANAWTVAFRTRRQRNPKRNLEEIGVEARTAIASSFLPVRCKERSLAAFALATHAGFRADLVVGCAQPCLELHCWAEVSGKILGEDTDRRRELIEIHRFHSANEED